MSKNATNAQFAHSDDQFKNACGKAGIPPTKRQASRWRNQKGLAWKSRNKQEA